MCGFSGRIGLLFENTHGKRNVDDVRSEERVVSLLVVYTMLDTGGIFESGKNGYKGSPFVGAWGIPLYHFSHIGWLQTLVV
jgi:hypothetical protein